MSRRQERISRKAARAEFEAHLRREFIRSAENYHGETFGRASKLTHAQHMAAAQRRLESRGRT